MLPFTQENQKLQNHPQIHQWECVSPHKKLLGPFNSLYHIPPIHFLCSKNFLNLLLSSVPVFVFFFARHPSTHGPQHGATCLPLEPSYTHPPFRNMALMNPYYTPWFPSVRLTIKPLFLGGPGVTLRNLCVPGTWVVEDQDTHRKRQTVREVELSWVVFFWI